MGPIMQLCSPQFTLIIHGSLPLNCQSYAQLHVMLLNSQEHKGNDATGELIGSLFNKLSTLLVVFVHSFGTEISIVHAG
jgi:hypothetical protein